MRLKLYLLWSALCAVYLCLGDGYYTEFPWAQEYVTELATGTGSSTNVTACSSNTTYAGFNAYDGLVGGTSDRVLIRQLHGPAGTNLCIPWQCKVGDITKTNAYVPFTLHTELCSSNSFDWTNATEVTWPSSTGVTYGLRYMVTNSVFGQTNVVATGPVSRAYVPNYGGSSFWLVWRTNANVVSNWCSTLHGTYQPDEASALSVAIDPSGNIFSAGYYRYHITMGGTNYTNSSSAYSGYIAKYDNAGQFQWGKLIGNSAVCKALGVAADSAGNVVVVGFYYVQSPPSSVTNLVLECTTLGRLSPDSSASSDAFVAKYDSAGTCLWATNLGGVSDDKATAVCIDTNDNIIVAGTTGSAVFNSGACSSSGWGTNNMWIVKMNSSGGCQWVKRFGGQETKELNSMALDQTNGIVVCGYVSVVNDFGGGASYVPGNYCGFVAKYSGDDGSYRWSTNFPCVNSSSAWGVAVDKSNGDILVGGSAAGGTPIGTNVVSNGGGSSAFLARYTASGAFLWSRTWGGEVNALDFVHGIAVHTNGEINITFRFMSALTLDGINWYWGNGLMNYMFVNLDSTGTARWWEKCETTSSQGWQVVLDTDGNAYASGDWQATGIFGGITVNASPCQLGAFVVRNKKR